jgi:hypothetical protein
MKEFCCEAEMYYQTVGRSSPVFKYCDKHSDGRPQHVFSKIKSLILCHNGTVLRVTNYFNTAKGYL